MYMQYHLLKDFYFLFSQPNIDNDIFFFPIVLFFILSVVSWWFDLLL